MNKLIITADDYGMSKGVNEAIEEGINAGLITSTNVMTNMPYFKDAKGLTKNPNISIGMHWNITCGRPVLPPEQIPSIVTNEGDFFDYPTFRSLYRKKKIVWGDIQKELIAQYKLYRNNIGKADYWNTHQNVHVDFDIYARFVALACKLNINRMRSHQRIYVNRERKQDPMPISWQIIEPVKSRMLDVWQSNAHKKGIKSPDGLILCLDKDDVYNLDYVFNHVQWKKNEIGEYVIHPATKNDSSFFGEIVERRIWEYKSFSSKDTKKMIKDAGIELASYLDL